MDRSAAMDDAVDLDVDCTGAEDVGNVDAREGERSAAILRQRGRPAGAVEDQGHLPWETGLRSAEDFELRRLIAARGERGGKPDSLTIVDGLGSGLMPSGKVNWPKPSVRACAVPLRPSPTTPASTAMTICLENGIFESLQTSCRRHNCRRPHAVDR